MKREEAINMLYGMQADNLNFDDLHTKDKYEALDMAIKTLEQEPYADWYDISSDEMTLEQARQAVKDLRKKLAEHLDQRPCGDAISRQAVLDAIAKNCIWENEYNLTSSRIKNAVEDLPPVSTEKTQKIEESNFDLKQYRVDLQCAFECGKNSVAEKTGRWIQTNEFFINQDGQFIYKFICSECKSLSYFRKSNKKAIGANVCPNCGAKMEVEE